MSTEITAEKVADFLTDADNDFHEGLDAWPSIRANGNVVEITLTPMDEDGDEDKDNASHFRAVVVEGDEAPVVAARPDVYAPDDMQGPAHTDSNQCGWHAFATSHVIFGGSGHISFAEARRMGAALLALADEYEADAAAVQGEAETR
ncbi:hypothetical protein [Streptosporangium roseum]|uniref:hypothetical protein n=1 Tax=Streptosporangium roseum TaxID=2001 RepID=UPI00333208FB